MAIFFGTDGIRGIVNDFLTYELAYKCGNAVAISATQLPKGNISEQKYSKLNNQNSLKLKERSLNASTLSQTKPRILIGGDTRLTRTFLTSAFSGGAMAGGADIVDVGVCPTAGIAYITKMLGFNFGVVVSASHNPAEYNGIKIFNENGFKLGDKKEELLEREFIHEVNMNYPQIGCYKQDFTLAKLYEDYLVSCCETDLRGLTILLDGSNGASYKIAPSVFRKLGAKVICKHCKNNGTKINYKCGSMYPHELSRLVKKYKADMGFAFDGDADRIVACDENGNILDGDIIVFMLACFLKQKGKLDKNTVVGTTHTNMGIEKDLNSRDISLLRTDIGDKYVIAKIEEEKLSLGGEKSGHIIFRKHSTTGDGILTGIKIAEMVKILGKKLSVISKANIYPQCNIDCVVNDKIRVINSEKLTNAIKVQQKILGSGARLMVRYSGTESKIRIMAECLDMQKAKHSAQEIEKIVYEIDSLNCCVKE